MDAMLDDFLTRSGLAAAGEPRCWTPLTGGVSSDIWRVDVASDRTFCVKRALPKLRVAAHWEAPVSRNAYEWAWMQFAARVLPGAVPQPLAHDEAAGLFAMSFLAPEQHPVWKQQLLAGRVEVATAAAVGAALGALHHASAERAADLAPAFDTAGNFFSLRLEPYLLATARRHPALAPQLEALVERTAAHRSALVHGDVSPKNILVGPHGPVLLDAECAWWGDPAFDLAFCLNHLLLKAVPQPDCTKALHQSFQALTAAYFDRIRFEPRAELEARASALLPALLLARVDGKSPVEYVTQDAQRERIRACAIPAVRQAPAKLEALAQRWFADCADMPA
ncbi:phosphotransferase family protein [Azohydromonas australica]|uniref:phosphotransferase family protein n=1 Tax=Azohydromonas australica TaxID=364039 RepID=UPI00041B3511|nr:phosphotransferase [Azohydromonas australica]